MEGGSISRTLQAIHTLQGMALLLSQAGQKSSRDCLQFSATTQAFPPRLDTGQEIPIKVAPRVPTVAQEVKNLLYP